MSSVSFHHIEKVYGQKVKVIHGISFDIQSGEFVVLVGPSGCGKSTLLRMLAGLEEISGGEIRIDDQVINDLESKDRDIAMVFQSYALYPNMTVAQNIAFGLEIRKVPKAERDAAVQRVAAMLQIGHLLDRKPGQLSGGQRQRVAMGRALARDPKLFLFDEPLSNLDAKLRVEMRAEIKQLHQRTQTTTVYVTHDQVEAMTLGDRIAVMKDGLVQQFGIPAEIYNRPATRFVAEFIGSPAMNMVDVQRQGQGVGAHGMDLSLTTAHQAAATAHSANDLVYGLRPECISFAQQGLPGQLSMIEPTGPETYATVDTVVGKLTARVPGVLNAQVGENVRLQWSPEQVHLFDRVSGVRVG